MIEADRGYHGELFYIRVQADAKCSDERYMKTNARSRHETANKRFKIFEILKSRFRHPLGKHSACFRAVVVIAQLSIVHGSPLYAVEYFDELKTNAKEMDFELNCE